jgi:hypothetical protein
MADEPNTQQPEEEGITVEVQPYDEKPGKPQLSDDEVEKLDSLPAEDEITKYAKDAQKRIKSLHIANQEWRRRVVQSTRDVATATNLAQQLYQENQQLKVNTQRSESALIEQALQRAEAQLAQAKSHFLAARNANDTAQELAAQEEIAQAVSERDRLRLLRPAPVKDGEPGTAPPGPSAQPAAAAPRPAAPPPPSEATQSWQRRNPWFDDPAEEKMRGYAMGVHESLERQGINEFNNPKEYWGTIDREMRERFPERFTEKADKADKADKAGSRPVAVAGATRTNGTAEPKRGPRHVVLTESQVSLARSLGLTNEQYAMQLVKDEGRQEGSYHDISTKRQ